MNGEFRVESAKLNVEVADGGLEIGDTRGTQSGGLVVLLRTVGLTGADPGGFWALERALRWLDNFAGLPKLWSWVRILGKMLWTRAGALHLIGVGSGVVSCVSIEPGEESKDQWVCPDTLRFWMASLSKIAGPAGDLGGVVGTAGPVGRY